MPVRRSRAGRWQLCQLSRVMTDAGRGREYGSGRLGVGSWEFGSLGIRDSGYVLGS